MDQKSVVGPESIICTLYVHVLFEEPSTAFSQLDFLPSRNSSMTSAVLAAISLSSALSK